MTSNLKQHMLVPLHIKLDDSEKKQLLEKYKITTKEMPKILKSDAAIAYLNVKVGDLIKIERNSSTAGKVAYYRIVVE